MDRQTFDQCQDVLHGRNRRTGKPNHPYAGGLLRCAHCGFAMTGERIRRKLRGGGICEHLYYRCGNNHPGPDHPVVRWCDEELDQALEKDLGTLRMPDQAIADWFRTTVSRAFDDMGAVERRQRQALAKRKADLTGMQDRLLNAYLAGAIDQLVFEAKSAELKRQLAEVEASLEQAEASDPEAPERALALFDFSQNLVDLWRGSNFAVRREILDCVSLNRRVSDLNVVLEKRKPFSFLAEQPFLKNGRGDRCSPYVIEASGLRLALGLFPALYPFPGEEVLRYIAPRRTGNRLRLSPTPHHPERTAASG